jgi:membrane associated rhomboid family serine protease
MNYTIIITIVTVIISLIGFRNHVFFNKFCFSPYAVAKYNEWYRFLTAGFLHADYMHLIFNMLAFFTFGQSVCNMYEDIFGAWGKLLFVLLYFTAIVFAHVTTYKKEKDNPSYRSIGASGGTSAIIYAAILLNPTGTMYIYGIPILNVLFGLIYLGLEYYLSTRNADNVNHDAHFIGAVYGFFYAVIFKPTLLLSFINEIKNYIV